MNEKKHYWVMWPSEGNVAFKNEKYWIIYGRHKPGYNKISELEHNESSFSKRIAFDELNSAFLNNITKMFDEFEYCYELNLNIKGLK